MYRVYCTLSLTVIIQQVIHFNFAVMRKKDSNSVSTKAPARAEFVCSNSIYKFRFMDFEFVWDFEYMDDPRDIFKGIVDRDPEIETRLIILVDLLMEYRECWIFSCSRKNDPFYFGDVEYKDYKCVIDKERADRIIRKAYEYAEVILWSLTTKDGRLLHVRYYTLAMMLMNIICEYAPASIVSDDVRAVLPKNPSNEHWFYYDFRKRLFVI